MITERTDLYEYFRLPRGGRQGGWLRSYRHGQIRELGADLRRPAMLVLPGGGYAALSQREDEPIAMRFFAAGYDAFVLEYGVAPAEHYPTPLEQAAMAMIYLRREAENLCIDGEHIAAVGFSAGGHLCGCIALLWDDPAVKALFGEECEKVRPDAAILSYPVVSAAEYVSHGGSFDNFCADRVPREEYSLEKRARPQASPAFIWATTTDEAVPVENSVLLYSALHAAGVPAELHLFAEGPHGLSTCDGEVYAQQPSEPLYKHAAHWMELALEFLSARGFAVLPVSAKK